jgi:hypothetical protein
MISYHPFVLVAITLQPISSRNIQGNTDESQWFIVVNIVVNGTNIRGSSGKSTFKVLWINAIKFGEIALDIGLNYLVNNLVFDIVNESLLVEEKGNSTVEEILYECGSLGLSFFLSTKDISNSLFFLNFLILLFDSDLLRCEIFISLRHLDNSGLITVRFLTAPKQSIFAAKAWLNESSGNIMTTSAVKLSDSGTQIYDHNYWIILV